MNKVLLSLVLILSGCVTHRQQVEWIPSFERDEFTDKAQCTVTVGSFVHLGASYQYSGALYPFIKNTSNGVIVGLMSGGAYSMPVAHDVQLRIDNNPVWTIKKEETPLDDSLATDPAFIHSKKMPASYMGILPRANSEKTAEAYAAFIKEINPQANPEKTADTYHALINELVPRDNLEKIAKTYKESIESIAKIRMPYTATGGEKARKIILEMLSGKKLIYRATGQFVGSKKKIAEYPLDDSLRAALISCGISGYE